MSVNENRVFVPAGAIAVGARATILTTVGLGSCVAIAIDDPAAAIGGLAHVFLPAPQPTRGKVLPGRYVATAVPLLVEQVLAAGGVRARLRARLAGGASMFPDLQSEAVAALGARNADAARSLLEELGIPIAGEDLGGNHGRSVSLHLEDGRFVVSSARAPEIVL